jgi:hypothetical protein
MTQAPGLAWSDDSTPDRSDARMPAFPRPEGLSYPGPAPSWPAFAAESHDPREVDASWPSSEEPPSRTDQSRADQLRAHASRADATDLTATGSEPAARPTAEPTRPTFPPLPPRSSTPTAQEVEREDGWRVRATAPDTWRVARLDLPPWPDLPETMPEADEPDWRSIEHRLQRAARLDREQRRR